MNCQGEPDYGVHPVLVGDGAFGFADMIDVFYLLFCSLKNVSRASITIRVMSVLFSDAKASTLLASLQGIWILNSLVKSEH